MTDPRRIGVSIDVQPHAYDPAVSPELFEGVLARRFVAFLIDVTIIASPVMRTAAVTRSRRVRDTTPNVSGPAGEPNSSGGPGATFICRPPGFVMVTR